MFEDAFGEIFDEGNEGTNARGINDVLEHLTRLMEEHDMPISLALEGLLNILKPGKTDISHDVITQFRTAMFLQDHGEVAEHIAAVWLTEFPWGIGFHFGFDEDYEVQAMSAEAKLAVIKALCAILRSGGIPAVMVNDRIRITHPVSGDEQDIDVESVVNQFRNEIDTELTDWMKRWMPDQ